MLIYSEAKAAKWNWSWQTKIHTDIASRAAMAAKDTSKSWNSFKGLTLRVFSSYILMTPDLYMHRGLNKNFFVKRERFFKDSLSDKQKTCNWLRLERNGLCSQVGTFVFEIFFSCEWYFWHHYILCTQTQYVYYIIGWLRTMYKKYYT